MNVQTSILRMDVSNTTTMITMGENCRIQDLTILLNCTGETNNVTLVGIRFGGTTTVTSKVRTCVVTVDNSSMSSALSSTVTAILCNGTGTLTSASFSFNCIKGSTINVKSNGAGNKRGILISNTNIATLRDTNVFVQMPTDPTGPTGYYIGVETADSNDTGSIQLRACTIGTQQPTGPQTYVASDIKQTNPTTITNPTYLASAGIQIGPGTDLVTKSAGSKGFSTYVYPTTIYYGLRGNIKDANAGYLWPGTQAISNSFPDTTTPPAYYRVQQPMLITGLSVGVVTATTDTDTVTVSVRYTPLGGSLSNTPFTVTLVAGEKFKNFYDASLRLNTGDYLHVYLSYTGGNGNTAHDLTVQVDLF